jgi:hypothetical protein
MILPAKSSNGVYRDLPFQSDIPFEADRRTLQRIMRVHDSWLAFGLDYGLQKQYSSFSGFGFFPMNIDFQDFKP